jgi:glycosyltransferase involved in cell wall biosynthesis
VSKKILFIAANHLESNPRLLKLLRLCDQNKFTIEVIFAQRYRPSFATDEKNMAQNFQVKFHPVDLTKISWVDKLLLKAFQVLHIPSKITEKIGLVVLQNLFCLAFFRTRVLLQSNPDLVVGYNFDSLPLSKYLATKYRAKLVYDIEDFYSFQHSGSLDQPDRSTYQLEKYYYSFANRLMIASPHFESVLRKITDVKQVFIPNSFDAVQQMPKHAAGIRMVWFSQTIGLDRGLQDVLLAMNELNHDDLYLHLYGEVSSSDREHLMSILSCQTKVIFEGTYPADVLQQHLSMYHLGLALERSNIINRDLCETNKLYQYLAAGIPTLMSDTTAQLAFHSRHKLCSMVYKQGNIEEMKTVLSKLTSDMQLLNSLNEQARVLSIDAGYSKSEKEILDIINS